MKRTIYLNATTRALLGADTDANLSGRIAQMAASWVQACDAGGIERDDADALPSALVRYRAILAAAMPALSVGEWALLCDALNGSVRSADHADTDPARGLAQSVADSGADGLAEKWGVDLAALAARLAALPYAGQCAVIETVSRFWSHAGSQLAPIADQLAAAGAKVASGEAETV